MTTETTPGLLTWLRDGGAVLPDVELSDPERGGRAVRATKRVEAGEVLVRIPRAMLLVDEVAGPRARLTAEVMRARRDERSPFRPWVETLPPSFDDHPVAYRKASRALLEGASVLDDIDRIRRSFETDREDLASIPDVAGGPWAEFAWAHFVTLTRSLRGTDDRMPHRMLVPLVDGLPHRHDASCRWTFDLDAAMFVVEARRPIEAGEELSLAYAKRCACGFFCVHGLLPESGAADCVSLCLRIPVGDELSLAFEQHALADAASTERMLEVLRSALVRGRPGFGLDVPPVEKVAPVSLDVESKVLTMLADHCDAALARLAAGDDARAHPDPSAATHVALCARMCEAEARALAFHRDFAREALAAVASGPAGLERMAADGRRAAHASYLDALRALPAGDPPG